MQYKNLYNKLLKDRVCNKYLYSLKQVLSFSFIITVTSCNKSVVVPAPDNALTGDNAYKTDATATAVMTGVYSYLSNATNPLFSGIDGISVQCGLSADELTPYSGTFVNLIAQYTNSLTSQNYPKIWNSSFYFLHTINSTLEGLSSSNTLSPAVKQELLGEAKFMRALFNFYLVNLYGDIPLITTSNYQINSTLGRASKNDVYALIINDLYEAKMKLSSNYVSANLQTTTNERIRPNKWVASALLARVYLYLNKFDSAENEATEIINSGKFSIAQNLNNVFLKNSSEAIWQLQPVNANQNTLDGILFILPNGGPSPFTNPVYLNTLLVNTFDSGDLRKTNWINAVRVGLTTYYYPYKYKATTLSSASATEYLMMFRLAEQYLIRSEARAHLNNINGAQSDLNVIRSRAGLPNTTATTQTALLAAILHERQVELFTELGHRWLDLKRTDNVNSVMSIVCPLKGGVWNPNWQYYPIPLSDILTDPNLVQNPGY